MSTIKWEAPESIATALSTELNALANATMSSASGAIDNATDKYLMMDVELYADWDVAPSAGGYVAVYLLPTLDGTNYADSHQDYAPHWLAAVPVRALTTVQRIIVRDLPVPPYSFKLAAYNGAGQAMSASGHTLKYRRHNGAVV